MPEASSQPCTARRLTHAGTPDPAGSAHNHRRGGRARRRPGGHRGGEHGGGGRCAGARDGNTPGWCYSPDGRRSPLPCDPCCRAQRSGHRGHRRGSWPGSTVGAHRPRSASCVPSGPPHPTASPSPPSSGVRRHTARAASQHLVSQPTQAPPASLPSPPSSQPDTPLLASAGARVRDTSPASPTTRRRGTPPKRVDRCNPRAQIAGSGRGLGSPADVVMARCTARAASA
jgi:hypothetical protein